MGWLIFAACLLLLLLLPIKLSVRFNESARIWLRFGLVRINLFPGKEPVSAKPQKKKDNFESQEKAKKKQKHDINFIIEIVKIVFNFLNDFRTKLRVDNLELRIILAGEDPCDLSVNYGRSWIALGNLYPLLDNFLVIKRREIEVQCDFTAEKTAVIASVDLSITVGRVLSIGLYHGYKLLRKYLSIMKKSKDGAVS